MMQKLYTPSAAEKWIIGVYKENGIITHNNMDIDIIADIWNIRIIYTKSPRPFSQWDSSEATIFLPIRRSKLEQRAAFFHELCHVLRHEGNQRNMPKLYRELQEDQACQFQLFASMPYPFIEPYLDDHSTTEIAEEFMITTDLVSKRLEQISNRIIANKSLLLSSDIRQASEPQKTKWSAETIKVMRQLNHILLNKQHTRYYGA